MNEVIMVPADEFERLQEYYKGQITQSAPLNKAGGLAAEKHLILTPQPFGWSNRWLENKPD